MKKTTTKKKARIRFTPDYTMTNRGPRLEVIDAMYQADLAVVFARCPVDNDLTPDTFDDDADVVCFDCRRGFVRAVDSLNSHAVRGEIEYARERLDPDAFADFIRDKHELEVEIAMDTANGAGLPPLDLVRDSVCVQVIKAELDRLPPRPKATGTSKPKADFIALSKERTTKSLQVACEFPLDDEAAAVALSDLLTRKQRTGTFRIRRSCSDRELARILLRMRDDGYFNGEVDRPLLAQWVSRVFKKYDRKERRWVDIEARLFHTTLHKAAEDRK
jgi:hypothetical protein